MGLWAAAKAGEIANCSRPHLKEDAVTIWRVYLSEISHPRKLDMCREQRLLSNILVSLKASKRERDLQAYRPSFHVPKRADNGHVRKVRVCVITRRPATTYAKVRLPAALLLCHKSSLTLSGLSRPSIERQIPNHERLETYIVEKGKFFERVAQRETRLCVACI